MAAIGDRASGCLKRNAAKRFDYQFAAAARTAAAESQRRHRQFESSCEGGAIVGDVLRECAVEVEAGTHRARLRVSAHVLRDVVVADRAGLVASVHEKPFEIYSFAAVH